MASLAHRTAVAWKAATGIFSDQRSTQAAEMMASLYRGRHGEPPDRGASGQLAAYSTMPRARAGFGLIAGAMSAVTWKVYATRKGPKTGQRKVYRDRLLQRSVGDYRKHLLIQRREEDQLDELDTHPALEFIHGGSSLLPGVAMFRVAQLHLDMVGEAFLVKERTRLQVPIAAWPIPPTWVIGTPTPERPTYQISWSSWQADIPEADVLWVRNPDPANPYGRGVGYAKALADELEADEFAGKTVRQIFFNRAQPDFLVFPKGERAEMDPKQTMRFEQDWMNRLQGYWRQWKPHFLSREVGIYEFQKDLRAMQFDEIRKSMRDVIFQTLGIPPEQLGIVENSNRATIEASDLIFAKRVLVDRLELWRSYFQEYLMPEYDDNLIIDYVTPVQEDKEFMLKVASAASFALTVDEWRMMMGKPELEDGRGVIHLVPMGMSPETFDLDAMRPEPVRPELPEPDLAGEAEVA